jgi:mono/diheme cytochrome c family protein
MKPFLALVSTGVAVAASVLALTSATNRALANSNRQTSQQEQIERGRYIVHGVGLCTDCHSPRDNKGEFLEGKHLTGAPIPFAATVPMPWVPVAPKIAGLPAGFTAEQTVHFLMTGERPNGRPAPLPPMPPYRMDRRDAEAVTAYLESLAPAAP